MLRNLRLNNYRNYPECEVNFTTGIHLVIGQNGQGKTNLIESIFLLSTGSLIRGSRDKDAILAGQTTSVVSGELTETGTELSVVIDLTARKKARLNGASLPRASDLLGRLPTVSFVSSDLDVVREEPSARRNFLDLQLSQISSAYFRNLVAYRRSLEQRNACLKAAQQGDRSFLGAMDAYTEQMAVHGAYLREERNLFMERLNFSAGEIHRTLGSGESFELQYEQKDLSIGTEELRQAYDRNIDADIQRGTTQLGPHRDDFSITVAGKDARQFSSQGQQRTAAIGLKLGVIPLILENLSIKPIILLDDVLSELDTSRRSLLVEWLAQQEMQSFLTCPEAEQAGRMIMDRSSILEVDSGKVVTKNP